MTPFLRYGNVISINNVERGGFLSASADIREHSDKARRIDSDILWSRAQHWTIRDHEGRTSAQRVKFGDIVSISINDFSKVGGNEWSASPWYLSVRNEYALDGGHKATGTMPQHLDSERWKIVDPSAPDSVREVKFGDVITLTALSGAGGYLSFADHRYTSTNPSLSKYERWKIGEVPMDFSLAASSPVAFGKGIASDDGAIELTTGLQIQSIVSKAVGAIPEIGTVLGPLVAFLWPAKGPDIWGLIKDRVQAVVNDAVFKEKVVTVEERLKGIQTTLNNYFETEGKLEKGIELKIAEGKLDDLKQAALNLERPETTLPHLTTLGTLHIAALRELCLHGPELFADDPSKYPTSDRIKKKRALKQAIEDYSNAVRIARGKALAWRLNKIRLDESGENVAKGRSSRTRHTWVVFDDYLGQAHGTWKDSIDTDNHNETKAKAVAEKKKYEARVTREFGQRLDHLLMPAFVWSYMSPEPEEIPLRTRASIVFGPYGGGGGGEFSDNPAGEPITGVAMRAGEFIDGLELTYGPRTEGVGWHGGGGGGLMNERLRPGEKIIGVRGRAGKHVDALYFETNQRTIVGGGGPGGNEFRVKLPELAEPVLVRVNGRAGEFIDQVSFEWEYTRLE